MNDTPITRRSVATAPRRKWKGETEWEGLRPEQAAGLEPAAEAAEGDFDWAPARVVLPPAKQVISMRFDRDMPAFFRAQGRGYQTCINAVLPRSMEAQRGRVG